MIPLMALGLLAANAMGVDYVRGRERTQLAEGMKGLLGTEPGAKAGDEGPVPVPGSGLMADPTNVANQFQFAQGLLQLPGGAKALQSFAPMLQQAVQSKQFERTEDRMGQQFNRTYEQTGQHQAQQQENWVESQARQQQQWKATFDENARQAAFQRQMESARLAQAASFHADSEGRADKRAAAATAAEAGGKVPVGYGVVETASGKSLAPMPGTENFGKVKAIEGTLVDTMGTINSLMDDYLGKEETTPDGNKKRVGGMGSEWRTPFTSGPANFAGMNAKRGSIIASLGAAREMGVLDKNEYERLTAQLPEVNDLMSKPKAFEAAYAGIRDEFARKLKTHRSANPWLVPPPPPGYK